MQSKQEQNLQLYKEASLIDDSMSIKNQIKKLCDLLSDLKKNLKPQLYTETVTLSQMPAYKTIMTKTLETYELYVENTKVFIDKLVEQLEKLDFETPENILFFAKSIQVNIDSIKDLAKQAKQQIAKLYNNGANKLLLEDARKEKLYEQAAAMHKFLDAQHPKLDDIAQLLRLATLDLAFSMMNQVSIGSRTTQFSSKNAEQAFEELRSEKGIFENFRDIKNTTEENVVSIPEPSTPDTDDAMDIAEEEEEEKEFFPAPELPQERKSKDIQNFTAALTPKQKHVEITSPGGTQTRLPLKNRSPISTQPQQETPTPTFNAEIPPPPISDSGEFLPPPPPINNCDNAQQKLKEQIAKNTKCSKIEFKSGMAIVKAEDIEKSAILVKLCRNVLTAYKLQGNNLVATELTGTDLTSDQVASIKEWCKENKTIQEPREKPEKSPEYTIGEAIITACRPKQETDSEVQAPKSTSEGDLAAAAAKVANNRGNFQSPSKNKQPKAEKKVTFGLSMLKKRKERPTTTVPSNPSQANGNELERKIQKISHGEGNSNRPQQNQQGESTFSAVLKGTQNNTPSSTTDKPTEQSIAIHSNPFGVILKKTNSKFAIKSQTKPTPNDPLTPDKSHSTAKDWIQRDGINDDLNTETSLDNSDTLPTPTSGSPG